MAERKKVYLNIDKETARSFIEWLANDNGGFGHTTIYREDAAEFIINGHNLLDYSRQMHQVVIDNCYVLCGGIGVYIVDGKTISNMEYTLTKLGF